MAVWCENLRVLTPPLFSVRHEQGELTMQERTRQEDDTPVLTAKDVEQAQERLERFWQDAMRRAEQVQAERERCAKRAS